MTATVFPGAPDPSHDVSLSDGTNVYGFTFSGGPRVLQEIPLSSPAQAWEVKQQNFIGGRGVINVKDDSTGYFDSQNLWSTSEGKIHPVPLWRNWQYASTFFETEVSLAIQWLPMYGGARYFTTLFTDASLLAADRAYIYLKKFGSPGNFTLELCLDNAGEPGTVLKTVTMSAATITDTVSVYKAFDWTGTQAIIDSATYHIKVYVSATDSASNHWKVLGYNGTGLTSADGTTWMANAYDLFFRLTETPSARTWFYFHLEGALYAVSKEANGGNSTLIMNGFRGIAASATSTTLTCSQAATRSYAGAFIKIIDGTGDGQVRQITSNTTGASIVFTVPAWDITPDATSKFIVYGTKFWDSATGSFSIGSVVNQPVVCNNVVYFPKGQSTNVVRLHVNGNVHEAVTEATVKADIMYVNTDGSTGTQVWFANAASSTVSNSNAATYATDLVALTTTTIGSTSFRITNMYNYSGQFYVLKEEGLFKFDGTRVTRFGRNFSDIPDANNGAAVSDDNTYLWFSWGHSAERMLGSNVTDMLNWRAGYDGMPDNRRGVVSQIVSAVGWLFFVIDGGASNYSSIIVWNGFGWHELFRGYEAGTRIRNAVWQPCQGTNPKLWVEIGGEMVYFDFPYNSAVPNRDTSIRYANEGVFVTPTIDAGNIQTYKIIKSVKIFQNATLFPGSVAQPVYIDYQINQDVDTSTWTYLGSADASPFEEVTMNIGGVTQIRFRFRISSNAHNTPAVITGWSVSGREMPLPKYQFVGTYVASTDQDTRQGEPDTNWNTIYTWLQTCAINQTKLTMRTLQASSDSKIVTVSLPVKTVDWVDSEDWGGRVSFICLEV